ncbi:MAG: pentapeptide repeat-containing protein [Actinomycetota bacterium]|nr:pentapeptide repeat-containing protein [Actinomycetota bacterium]
MDTVRDWPARSAGASLAGASLAGASLAGAELSGAGVEAAVDSLLLLPPHAASSRAEAAMSAAALPLLPIARALRRIW